MIDIQKIMNSKGVYTDGERLLAEWMATERGLWHAGSFTMALFDAISKADSTNLIRLWHGFPSEVTAWRQWRGGNLKQRFEETE